MAIVGPMLLDTIGVSEALNIFLQHDACGIVWLTETRHPITHSQSGQFGWILADARPNLVQAIIAIETIGPPFTNAVFGTELARPFGLTEVPLTFSPPITSAADLQPVDSELVGSDPSANFTCFRLASRRQLVNLMDAPVLIVTGDASYHTVYDGCTAEFLSRASVPVEHVQLGDVGIYGNGHMMFLELNADIILHQVLLPFIKNVS